MLVIVFLIEFAAFDAELASYDQVKDAWQKGADWCNYGWVKGQAAAAERLALKYQEYP